MNIEFYHDENYFAKVFDNGKVVGRVMIKGGSPKFRSHCFFTLSEGGLFTAIVRALIQLTTQREFAARTGFSIATVKSWSSGIRTPSAGTLRLLLIERGLINPAL